MVAEKAGSDLGAAEVLQQRDAAAGLSRQRPDAGHDLGVRVVGPVREVQAEDVHAGRDQIAQPGFAGRCGPDRGDDLSSASQWLPLANAGTLALEAKP